MCPQKICIGLSCPNLSTQVQLFITLLLSPNTQVGAFQHVTAILCPEDVTGLVFGVLS